MPEEYTLLSYRQEDKCFCIEEIFNSENMIKKMKRCQVLVKGNWNDRIDKLSERIYNGSIICLSRRDFYPEKSIMPVIKKYHLLNINNSNIYTDFNEAFNEFLKCA